MSNILTQEQLDKMYPEFTRRVPIDGDLCQFENRKAVVLPDGEYEFQQKAWQEKAEITGGMCMECGGEFEQLPYAIKFYPQGKDHSLYCSQQCAHNSFNRIAKSFGQIPP